MANIRADLAILVRTHFILENQAIGVGRDFDPKLTWDSTKDDLINGFYKPALFNCTTYQRISGYFSSSTFAFITKEIIDFIKSDGKIQLITSRELSERDKEIFEESIHKRDEMLSQKFFEDIKNDPDGIKLEFWKIMAYMLVNRIKGTPQLEIKIAVPIRHPGLFHHKIGIMKYSNGERLAFAGSINETGMGWHKNAENLSVFKSWGDSNDQQRIMDHQRIFNDLWSNNEKGIRVVELPKAVEEHLFEIRPRSNQEFNETLENIKKILNEEKEKNVKEIPPDPKIMLRQHQNDAIQKWTENEYRGLLEMATGTGKTFTAFGCINMIQKMHERTIIIIACPQKHLVMQWNDEIRKWNNGVLESKKIDLKSSVICNSDYNWRPEFMNSMKHLTIKPLGHKEYMRNHIVIFTTHDTLQKPALINRVLETKDIKKFIIIDEVHNITPKSSSIIFSDKFNFRLGLSATPVRHMDEKGTDILKNYFHGIVYTLDLNSAIHKLQVLSTYDYMPYYVELTNDEMVEYNRLSSIIAQIEIKKKKPGYVVQPNEESVYRTRADLVANAQNKDVKLEEILDQLNNRLHRTLIYCTNNPSPIESGRNVRQLERVKNILTRRRIDSDSITWEVKTKDRGHILELMDLGHFDCVTAVKCLDEGVDIPSIEMCIVMASSGNPKQFIQRRGRVLRKDYKSGKTHAYIYDILVTPQISNKESEFNISERRLIAKELLRHKEFATIASNSKEAIDSIRDIARMFKINFDELNYEYIQNME